MLNITEPGQANHRFALLGDSVAWGMLLAFAGDEERSGDDKKRHPKGNAKRHDNVVEHQSCPFRDSTIGLIISSLISENLVTPTCWNASRTGSSPR